MRCPSQGDAARPPSPGFLSLLPSGSLPAPESVSLSLGLWVFFPLPSPGSSLCLLVLSLFFWHKVHSWHRHYIWLCGTGRITSLSESVPLSEPQFSYLENEDKNSCRLNPGFVRFRENPCSVFNTLLGHSRCLVIGSCSCAESACLALSSPPFSLPFHPLLLPLPLLLLHLLGPCLLPREGLGSNPAARSCPARRPAPPFLPGPTRLQPGFGPVLGLPLGARGPGLGPFSTQRGAPRQVLAGVSWWESSAVASQ